MYKRILVATDGSELSNKAVNHAITLAKLSGAELVGLTVVAHYPVSYYEGSVSASPDEVARIDAQWLELGKQKVGAVQAAAASQDIDAKLAVVRSDFVADAIVSAAKERGCDLIVMASHGRKGIKRLLLGSETLHVLTHSDIPVLVLR